MPIRRRHCVHSMEVGALKVKAEMSETYNSAVNVLCVQRKDSWTRWIQTGNHGWRTWKDEGAPW